MAERDARVVSGAVVGSLALGGGDQYSDLDLSFAVDDDIAVEDVLDDWTPAILRTFDASHLFDLSAGSFVYRVFMMPGGVQLDLSLAPAAAFYPTSPRFRLLFGTAGEMVEPVQPNPDDIVGWAVLWARDTRVCIERGRLWQAESSLTELRRNALALACLQRGLPARYGKGFDRLSEDVVSPFTDTFPGGIDAQALRASLRRTVEATIALHGNDLPDALVARLREAADLER